MSLLAALRADLDLMPSPVSDRPGLLMRDSFGYAGGTIILPPLLVQCLRCFDGSHTRQDLQQLLSRLTGELDVSALADHLEQALSTNGFLKNEVYAERREAKHREFAQAAVRVPCHAGSAYPLEPGPLGETMRRYLDGTGNAVRGVRAIAAPHVSPEGGWQSYRAAYRNLGPELKDRTFVVLGTSHYGEPEKFGLTLKAYETPLGTTRTDPELISQLAASKGAVMEDYCHAVEHSIEFQVLFLQWLYGPDIRVLPILCGSFVDSIYYGAARPEDNDGVASFLGTLGDLAARESDRLCWVLGIDMAHQGRRYGDRSPALANEGQMESVFARDQQRIERMLAGDADGFWGLVKENRDDLRWCGSSPIYTFLKAVPGVRGTLHRYEQWNIDPDSVVSFAGASFSSS